MEPSPDDPEALRARLRANALLSARFRAEGIEHVPVSPDDDEAARDRLRQNPLLIARLRAEAGPSEEPSPDDDEALRSRLRAEPLLIARMRAEGLFSGARGAGGAVPKRRRWKPPSAPDMAQYLLEVLRRLCIVARLARYDREGMRFDLDVTLDGSKRLRGIEDLIGD